MNPEWPGNELKVCRFVRAHYEPWAHAPVSRLLEYFGWYAKLNLLGIVLHEQKVMAVATARFFHSPSDYRREFVHDPAGRYVKASLYGALCPAAMAVLAGRVARVHDVRGRIFLWHRDAGELGPPREYSLERFSRLVRSLLYVRRERTNTTIPDTICTS